MNSDLRKILQNPIIYTTYQKLVGGYRARRLFAEQHIKIEKGQRILDFGCGPGDILEFFPEVNYLGIDIDEDYIKKATNKYGDRASFQCSEINEVKLNEPNSFDFVIAAGVLHHLNDSECSEFFDLAKKALKPNGKLLTLDGVYIPNQNKISKYLLDKDRGEYVRTLEAYKVLTNTHFKNFKTTIEEHYFHIPYTLLIMEASL